MKNKKKKTTIYSRATIEKYHTAIKQEEGKEKHKPCKILVPPNSFKKGYSKEYIENYYAKDLKGLKTKTKIYKLCLMSSLICASLVTPLLLVSSASALGELSVKKDVEREMFVESQEYNTVYRKDYDALKERVENGQISGEEYLEELTYLGSKEYVKEVMKSSNTKFDTKNNESVKKAKQRTKAIATGSAGAFGTSLALAFVAKPISDACDKEEEKLKKRGLNFKSVDFI